MAAAINAAANSRLSSLITPETLAAPRLGSAFDYFLDRVKGLKVAVVGHFPKLESLAEETTLTILERQPQPGDLPDPAAEYVLEDQDAVFLTGTTIINKTLPRLLELAEGKDVFLVGPSVPMFEELFKFGLASLSGTLVADPKDLAAYFGVSQATICKRLHALSGAGLVVEKGKHRGIALKGRTRR